MVNSGKHNTRSQTSISDFFVPLDRSPLKQARSAQRNEDIIVATDSSDADSSSGVTSGKKRSASPPAIDREESVERELKRSKISAGEDDAHESSASGWKLQPFPLLNIPSTLPPASDSGSNTPTRGTGPSPRARSVPPTIPTTPGQVPYLDLSKYRSPTKSAHRVRMMSVPPSSSPGRDGGGDGGDGRGVGADRDLDKTPVPRLIFEKVERVRRVLDHPPPALVVAPISGSQNDDPFSHEPDALPKTPVRKALSLEPMSPLTPLSSSHSPSQPPSLIPPPPNNNVTPEPMNVDPPVPLPPLQLQPKPPSVPKREPRLSPTKQPSHLIPPQPKPLSFPLPSRSPTPPSQRTARSRSVSVEPPIPALPYPLLPSTSNPPALPASEPEPVLLVAPTIPDPQPSKESDAPELPPTTKPPDPEVAPELPPAPGTAQPDEGKGKAKEQAPGPSKLPAAKSTKTSRLRSTTDAGPSGVTRTRATKGAVRHTPISRDRRVTRSSAAKNRQADALKETGSKDLATDPKETGTTEIGKDGKDGKGSGINIVRLLLVFGREPDMRTAALQHSHQPLSRQKLGSQWVSLYPLPVRRRSRDLLPRLNPNQPPLPSKPQEDPMNLAPPPP